MYAWNQETFGPGGTLGRESVRDAALKPDLRRALRGLNDGVPDAVIEQAMTKLTTVDRARSTLQHNQEFYGWIRDGVPMEWRDAAGRRHQQRLRLLDFDDPTNNRFVAVRELKLQGLDVPHYNRRADLVCFVNGLPLVFIELKAVYLNIRAGFDENLTDYLHQSIPHAFHHNVFMVVSHGNRARYGSITSGWDHFAEWNREDLDDQIWRTFVGCGIVDEQCPRAGSGRQLQLLLKGRHRYVFSLVHKFNQTVREPYSERDDIIVLSDEVPASRGLGADCWLPAAETRRRKAGASSRG